MIDKNKLHVSKRYYMNGEILCSPNSDYVLLRVYEIEPFPSILYLLGSECIGIYAIIYAEKCWVTKQRTLCPGTSPAYYTTTEELV